MEIVQWLQDWYAKQCDGDWEHLFGIKIDTLDNPGWSVDINLEDTELHGLELENEMVENSEEDWYSFEIKENVFKAAGDPQKLIFLLQKFKEIVQANT